MDEIYHIIYNPYAKRGGAAKYLDAFTALLDRKGKTWTLHKTDKPGHATDITRDIIKNGAKYIVIMGGDGTVHEVVNGYTGGDDVVFGILPAGTGNDVASMLKVPAGIENIEAACLDILEENVKYVDYIVNENGKQSLLFFSYGIATQMILDMNKYKIKNKLSYYRSLMINMFKFKAKEYEVTADGKTRKVKADFCALHNCIYAGGGMHLIDRAVMDDGLAELFIVEYKGMLRRILNLISIMSKKVHLQPNVQITPVSSAVIQSFDDGKCCIDGEIYEMNRLKLSVIQKAVKVFGK